MPAREQQRARREAVQPSLWDRLINDLPGLSSEIDDLTSTLRAEIGDERVDTLLVVEGRGLDADSALTLDQKQRLHRLVVQRRQRDEIERRSIVVSTRVLREAVRRDIEALFNTERYESTPLLSDHEADLSPNLPDLADFPEVRRSVMNFGVPSFSGRTSYDFDTEQLQKEIRVILATFEPRLREGSTKVDVTLGDKVGGMRIEIDAILMTSPTPERLKLRTTINLDNGWARTEFGDT